MVKKGFSSNLNRIFVVTFFAIAFAFVESAVVVYLRRLLGVETNLYTLISKEEILFSLPGIAFLYPDSLPRILDSLLLNVEMVREGATIVILLTVAFLAGYNLKERIAYFFLAFGIWDIFYYVFLKIILDWPKSLFDPDIFFLLPVPWVGPVIFPVIISLIIVATSTLYLLREKY